jgi:hypothetical protein
MHSILFHSTKKASDPQRLIHRMLPALALHGSLLFSRRLMSQWVQHASFFSFILYFRLERQH